MFYECTILYKKNGASYIKNMVRLSWLFVLVFMVFSACSDDEPGVTIPEPEEPDVPVAADTMYWEMPHSRFFGLNGQVKLCVQSGLDDEGIEAERRTMEFDSCGRLLWYDPVGLSAGEEKRAVTYEAGWIDPTTYGYEYNAAGQLVKAVLETMGSEPDVYHLEYGNHGRYVPLPFSLGSMSFFLVRDLVKVSRTDGWEYVFDGTKSQLSITSWVGTTEIEYDFTGMYPNRKIETTYRGVDTSSIEITTYVFDEKGGLKSLLTSSYRPGDESETRTEMEYASSFLLKPLTEIISFSGDRSIRYEYSYDPVGNMLIKSYVHTANGQETSGREETNTYFEPDRSGNWTKRKCVIPGMGTLLYVRTMEYYID